MLNLMEKIRRRFRFSWNSWGAQAERKVRRILEQLPMDRFIVMNDVRIKYGNIDHLVIRDDGAIFIIETKSHRGTVTFDGKQILLNRKPFKKNPICQMNRNIRWLREYFPLLTGESTWFTAILVFPEAKLQIIRPVKGIQCVGTPAELARLIAGTKR